MNSATIPSEVFASCPHCTQPYVGELKIAATNKTEELCLLIEPPHLANEQEIDSAQAGGLRLRLCTT